MEILGSQNKYLLILMMNFMEFVEHFNIMRPSVCPVEEEVFNVE